MLVNILVFLYYFVWNWIFLCGMDKLYVVVKFIFYFNVFLNFCVYFILNKKYCEGLKDLIKCLYFVWEGELEMLL